MTLSEDDLSPADRKILELLRVGRCTPSYIADETGYANGSVRNRLRRLVEHGHVTKIHTGLYELVADPRNNDDP